jgi:arginine/lysine/ornithine decarboxylase
MVTPENDPNQLNVLTKALMLPKRQASAPHCSFVPSQNTRKMSIREAFFSPHELIAVEKAVGRVCAAPTVSCPPAIPIVISGEIIKEGNVKVFLQYNIKQIEVVVE